ncbi:MAG: helix-turn-helix transcriptional regulator [Treponema sp.]|nr:helix-turn-helix transcriptional regulator [Candidatus Treponema equifaecale]
MTSYQEAFIKNLKTARKEKNISQAKLAELCNVSTGTIGNIECGKAEPSFGLLFVLADALETTASDLIKEPKNITPRSEELITDGQLIKIKERLNEVLQEAFNETFQQFQYNPRHRI